VSRFWSPVVHGLTLYVPGEQPKLDNLIKLNTNENPYPPSPHALAAIAAATDRLRLYPDPRASTLCEAIANHYGVAPGEVFVGNGSDEVLAHAFQALLKHDAPLLFPDITYSFFPVWCQLYGIRYENVPLDAAMRVQISDYRRPCSTILLPNPNAPTGIALPREAIEQLVTEHPDQLVVIDEAYVDFGAESAVPLVARHDNLLVVQTLSKSRALAGLRVGFAIGQRPLIEALERVKDSFNSYPIDGLAIAGAAAAIKDDAGSRRRGRASWRVGKRSCAVSPTSASRCCHRWRTSCSRVTPGTAAPIWPQGFASRASWSGISKSRALRTSCASRLVPRSSAAA
jgi:histidinol-phosphate aminotransferase